MVKALQTSSKRDQDKTNSWMALSSKSVPMHRQQWPIGVMQKVSQRETVGAAADCAAVRLDHGRCACRVSTNGDLTARLHAQVMEGERSMV